MAVLQLHWIVGIIFAVSFTNALPPNIPSNHILASSGFNSTSFNLTNAECVGNIGLKIGRFFAFNYITHAFTVKPGVGYRVTYASLFAIAAFFLPYYGLLLACRGIEPWAVGEKHTLKRAARGGALCVVARTKKWRPKIEDLNPVQGQDQAGVWCWRTIRAGDVSGQPLADEARGGANPEVPSTVVAGRVNYAGLELEYLSQDFVQIHGVCQLPDGGEYALARLPPYYEVEWQLLGEGWSEDQDEKHREISSDYSIVRRVIGMIQLLAAVPTIYAAHNAESQRSRGYAGYQLTVIPYALMSIINTFTNFVTPSYAASYMVRTSIMIEAEKRGGIFKGHIGVAPESSEKILLGCPVSGFQEIIGEVGTPDRESISDSGYTMVFSGSNVKLKVDCCAGTQKHRYPLIHSVKKASHFIFRQHIWEAVREEFPVFRWFLYYREKKELEARPERHTTKTRLERLTPERTCIVRLFKRFSEPRKKLEAMILYPSIGNLTPRKKERVEDAMYIITDVIFILSIAAPYLLTYALTKYKAGDSTLFQRLIVTLWLVNMQIACIPQRAVWNFVQTRLVPLGPGQVNQGLAYVMVLGFLWSIPGIIGFTIVLRLMINDNKNACDGIFAYVVKTLGIGTDV